MNFGPFGIWEILIVLAVALLIFGPSRLPAMARGMGRSVREFRDGIREMRGDLDGANDEAERRANAPERSRPARSKSEATSEPVVSQATEPSSENTRG